jgi:2-methylcitrate dehydratase PrpD
MIERRHLILSALGGGAAFALAIEGCTEDGTPRAVSADSGNAASKSVLADAGSKPAEQPRALQEAPEWSSALTRFITGARQAPLPEEVSELAKRHMLDTFASIVACRDLAPARLARSFATAQSAGSSVAPILGTQEGASLLEAIFASAMCAHAAEINDFEPSAFVQPGAAVLPATLCLGVTRKATGAALLRALIVGYEISGRLPKALGNRNMINAVLANHSVGPLFGVAAACASLLDLPAERLNHVYAYCVQQAAGSWQWLRDVEHVEKAFAFAGMPARRGTECALLVEAGFTALGDPFVGEPGWLNSSMFTADESDFMPSVLTQDLGTQFELPLVGYKRYPVGGPTQSAVQLMLDFVKDLDPKQVKKVRVEMPGRAAAFASAGMPALNLPYLCSIILIDGKLDFTAAQSRERFLNDAQVRAFMPNVEIVYDADQERVPRVESARVRLTLEDGTTREAFLEHVKGYPDFPMEREDVQTKARELLTPRLGAARVDQLIDAVWLIERADSLDALVELIAT